MLRPANFCISVATGCSVKVVVRLDCQYMRCPNKYSAMAKHDTCCFSAMHVNIDNDPSGSAGDPSVHLLSLSSAVLTSLALCAYECFCRLPRNLPHVGVLRKSTGNW